MRRTALPALLLTGCVQGGIQFEGVGSVYHTRCSASMEAKGEAYFARCEPPACADGFTSGTINHVAVAVDPGKKVVGYAERPCLQDPRLELGEAPAALTTSAPQRPPPLGTSAEASTSSP